TIPAIQPISPRMLHVPLLSHISPPCNSTSLTNIFFLSFFFLLLPPPLTSTLFPYTTLFRSSINFGFGLLWLRESGKRCGMTPSYTGGSLDGKRIRRRNSVKKGGETPSITR